MRRKIKKNEILDKTDEFIGLKLARMLKPSQFTLKHLKYNETDRGTKHFHLGTKTNMPKFDYLLLKKY